MLNLSKQKERITDINQKIGNIKTGSALLALCFMTLALYVIYFFRPLLVDDGFFHLSRLKSLADELSFSNPKPWMYSKPVYETGYPLGIYYPDIFLYPFAILIKMGVGTYFTYLLMMISISFASTVSFYFCSKKMLEYIKYEECQNTAFAMSIMYIVSPYRLFDLFFRMAIGESMFFVFAPIAILGAYELLYLKKFNIKLFVAMTGLMHSHFISVVIMTVILIIIYLLKIKKIVEYPKIIMYTIINAIMTIFCSVSIILPMLEMQNFTTMFYETGEKTFGELKLHLYCFGINKYVSVAISIVLVITFVAVLLKCDFRKKMWAVVFFDIILCTDLFCWEFLEEWMPALNTIQFPWRLLCISAIPLAVLYGTSFRNKLVGCVIIFLLFLYLVCVKNINNPYIYDISRYNNSMRYIGAADYMVDELRNYCNKHDCIPDVTGEYDITKKDNVYEFTAENGEVVLPLGYYKGYEILGRNTSYGYEKSEYGLIKVTGLKDNKLTVNYKGTLIQKVSLAVSCISFLFILIILGVRKKQC